MSTGRGVEDLLRELAPQVLGAVVRRSGDFDRAEDAVQDALLVAATRWPVVGTPANPRGWLVQVAQRRLTDRWRRDGARRRREGLAAAREPTDPGEPDGPPDHDDTLVLMLLCCHPALSPASAIPLTLRAVGGLTTAEIARAFLVPETTMAQRITRAKQRLRGLDAPFRLPSGAELTSRVRSVLHVLYLMFNEGHTSTSGPRLARIELSAEAIRLARLAHGALPDDPEVAGLLALMLLNDARRPARTGPGGELIPLAEQDRSLWDRCQIDEGTALIDEAIARGRVGEYQVQAAINALHDQAPTADETDWPQILVLYDLLERMTRNPMVALNRAIAAAMVHGPAAGLALLEPLDEPLGGHHRLDATRAHLYEMAGHTAAAVEHYRRAAACTTSAPEQQYLTTQAARLGTGRTRRGPAVHDAEQPAVVRRQHRRWHRCSRGAGGRGPDHCGTYRLTLLPPPRRAPPPGQAACGRGGAGETGMVAWQPVASHRLDAPIRAEATCNLLVARVLV